MRHDGRERPDPGEKLDRWLREEAEVLAPDRLLEEVFARTEGARQEHRGWSGQIRRLLGGGSSAGREGRISGLQRGAVGVAAVLVFTLVGLGAIARLSAGRGAASVPPSPSGGVPSGGAAREPSLVIERSTPSCAHRGVLTVVPAASGTRSSAWLTCGVDSEEIVLGTGTVTRRPGLGAITSDGTSDWAISGDSVVRLNPDRSIAQTVRIGTPSAIAIGSGAVWALDPRTGTLSSIGPAGVHQTVTTASDGHLVGLAIAGGSMWVLDQTNGQLLRRGVDDGRPLGTIAVPPGSTNLVSAAGALYVADPLTGTIVRIDPSTARATTLHPNLGGDGHIDALGGSVDALLLGSRTSVLRLDPTTTEPLSRADSGAYVDAVAQDGSTVLVLQDGTFLEATFP